jgi:hypothetical protein
MNIITSAKNYFTDNSKEGLKLISKLVEMAEAIGIVKKDIAPETPPQGSPSKKKDEDKKNTGATGNSEINQMGILENADKTISDLAQMIGAAGDTLLRETEGGSTLNPLKYLAAGVTGKGYSIDSIAKRMTVLTPLFTGEPVGEWHLTVGNPMNPFMMIGNLICTLAEINFNDTLGPDDFPTQLKAKITLKHARHRDKGDIESMFNLGQGRFYVNVENEPEPWNTGFSSNDSANDGGKLDESQLEGQIGKDAKKGSNNGNGNGTGSNGGKTPEIPGKPNENEQINQFMKDLEDKIDEELWLSKDPVFPEVT